jgi:hypothetical protein
MVDPMRRFLLDYFFENASNYVDAALTDLPQITMQAWTYPAIAQASFQFARELCIRNIGKRDRIIIAIENTPSCKQGCVHCS